MRLLMKPWFALVVALVVLAVWAATTGPWGPLRAHSRTALAWRVAVSTRPAARHVALSPPLILTGDPARLRFFASPPSDGREATGFPVADVRWAILGAGAVPSGDAGLMPAEPNSGSIRLGSEKGSGLHGTYRLRVTTRLTSPGEIGATIVERRDYRQASVGGVPIFWVILLAGTAYVSLTVVLLRRKYPPNPVMTPSQRERY